MGRPCGSRNSIRNSPTFLMCKTQLPRKVVAALALRLDYDERRKLTQRYTENVDAYHQYLLGRHHISKLTRPGIRKSIVFFQQAIDIDPTI